MKKIFYPLFAFAVLVFVGCDTPQSGSSEESDRKSAVASCLSRELSKTECVEMGNLLSDSTNRMTDNAPLSKFGDLGGGQRVGDRNIFVERDPSDDHLKLYVITKTTGGVSGDDKAVVDLSTNAARIKMLKSGEFNIEKFPSGKLYELPRKLEWSINPKFGMKIVPDYRGTKYPALIGMDDAREYTGTMVGAGFEVLIDRISWPNEKKVHFYLDGSVLKVSATNSTKMQESTANVYKEKVGDICWGRFKQCCVDGSCAIIP